MKHSFFTQDGTSGKNKEDDGVAPNGKYTYVWEVKKEHGPLESDSDCLTWAYHSHVHAQNDVNTGLVGKNKEQKVTRLLNRINFRG